MGVAPTRTSRVTERRSALSRTVSHALRHEPWIYELEVDDEGWVPIDELIAALRRDPYWSTLTRAELVETVSNASKHRHEVDDDRIRALYGHSLPGRVAKSQGVPPRLLLHGTGAESVPGILRTGLLPMGRQYVHLSVDIDTAMAVGHRKSDQVAVLRVAAEAAHAAGVLFLQGNAAVWLVDHVPPEYLRLN